MSKDFKAITQSVSQGLGKIRKHSAGVTDGFSGLGQATMSDGALDKKTKELIALGIAVADRCDACIGFHMKTLVKLNATAEEVAEAVGVAVYMGGGPALMYAAGAMDAWEQLQGEG